MDDAGVIHPMCLEAPLAVTVFASKVFFPV